MRWSSIIGTVQPGHQIASGLAEDSPYGAGSIELQAPYFAGLGLDLTPFYFGTINLSIAPYRFQLKQPRWQFCDLRWTDRHPPETFSFCQAELIWKKKIVSGLVYYPHPETKRSHFQADSVLELLAPKLSGLSYGDRLQLRVNPAEIMLIND